MASDPQPTHLLQFDGGARNNPGKAAGAAYLTRIGEKNALFEVAIYIPHATNNYAEYMGLYVGLEKAAQLGIKLISIEGDSALVVNQITGEWKVKHDGLKSVYSDVMKLLDSFTYVEVCHIPRENNTYADKLVNEAIDNEQSFYRGVECTENKKKSPLQRIQNDIQEANEDLTTILSLLTKLA